MADEPLRAFPETVVAVEEAVMVDKPLDCKGSIGGHSELMIADGADDTWVER